MSVESEAYENIHPNYNIKGNKKTEIDLCSKDAYESKEIKIIWYYFYDKRYNEISRVKKYVLQSICLIKALRK